MVEAVADPYAGGKASVKVVVEGKDLTGTTYCDENGDTISALTYDAAPVELSFKVSGNVLREDVDYTVRYFKSSEDYNGTGSEEAPTDAGSYVARLTGAGEYAGSKVNVPLMSTSQASPATSSSRLRPPPSRAPRRSPPTSS